MHKGSILGFIFGLVVGGAASGLGVYGVMKKKHDKEMTEALANKHAFEPVSEEEDDVPDMYKRTVKKGRRNTCSLTGRKAENKG